MGRPGSWGFGFISVASGFAAGGFAFTATPFGKRPKGSKGLGPGVRPLAGARGSFAPEFIRGHRLRFAALHLLSMCSTASNGAARQPRMNPSTQPAEGAGTSKAVLELTLIVLSGAAAPLLGVGGGLSDLDFVLDSPLTPALSRGRGSRPRCLRTYIDLNLCIDYGFTRALSGRRISQASHGRSPLPLGEG